MFECEFTLVRKRQRTALSVYLTSCSVLLLAPTSVDTVNSLCLDAGQKSISTPMAHSSFVLYTGDFADGIPPLWGDSVGGRIGGNKQLYSTRLTWEQASIHPLYVDSAATLNDAALSPDMITNVDWTYPQLNKCGCQMFLTSLWEFSLGQSFHGCGHNCSFVNRNLTIEVC